jgi:hypothetical protein
MKRLLTRIAIAALLASAALSAPTDLASEFRDPPDPARPWVYWFWIDGNITREGITADLEAMHRAGIRGAIIMKWTCSCRRARCAS